MTTKILTCPDCDVELNHHANKLVDPVNEEEAALADLDLGALVAEFHTCPGCGKGFSRRPEEHRD